MVSRAIVLDSGPLGIVTNPRQTPATEACTRWLSALFSKNVPVFVPEIADYEVRRELIRAGKKQGLRRLDRFVHAVSYLPLTTGVMRDAAQLWAIVRQSGQSTADRHALDGDVILAAQARSLGLEDVVVATTNVKHLSRFVNAAHWSEIN